MGMTRNELIELLASAGCPMELMTDADDESVAVLKRFAGIVTDRVREKCAREMEQFARDFVAKWEGVHLERVKTEGWAIMQAAAHLRADREDIMVDRRDEAGLGAWIPCSERLPDDRQDVSFVVKSDNLLAYLNGRVLGGRYQAGYGGGFTVPGMVVDATYWMPQQDAPSAPINPATAAKKPAELATKRVRINAGALVTQDHSSWKWCGMKDGAEIDQNIIFDAEWNGGYWDCRSDGYGRRSWRGEEGEYGNGSIFVRDHGGVTLLDDESDE